jgi:hypothetical protein
VSTIQNEILGHMKCGFTITPAVAAQDYSCYCLAAVISKIRKKDITVYAREIQGTRSKEYSLSKFPKN